MLIFSPFSMAVMRVLSGVFLLIYGVSELMSMTRAQKAQAEYEIRYGDASSFNQDQVGSSDTSYENVTFSSGDGKLDTSGISDAKEVDFEEEK